MDSLSFYWNVIINLAEMKNSVFFWKGLLANGQKFFILQNYLQSKWVEGMELVDTGGGHVFSHLFIYSET